MYVAILRETQTHSNMNVCRSLLLQPYVISFLISSISFNLYADEARAKWEAWESRKGMSTEEAQKLYVEEWEKQKAEYMPKE